MTNLISDWKKRKEQSYPVHKKLVQRLRKKRGKKLNELGERLHEEVFEKIDCLDCANCCTSIPPIVNKTDVKRIARHLKMKPAEFSDAYLTQDEDGDTVMNTTPCPFLGEDHLCSIYLYRPKACAAYPHTNHMEFSQNLRLHATNAQYCPAVFHILEKLQQIV